MDIIRPKESEKERVVIYDYNEKVFLDRLLFEEDKITIDFKSYSTLSIKYKIQSRKEGKWVDSVSYKYLLNDDKYENIDYFYKRNDNSDKLVVIFPGLLPVPNYIFIEESSNINASVLYLKDSLSKDGFPHSFLAFEQQKNIQDLIFLAVEWSGSSLDKTVSCGSSFGGGPAIFYASKCAIKNILVGSPSYLFCSLRSNYQMYDQLGSKVRNLLEGIVDEIISNNRITGETLEFMIRDAFLASNVEHKVIMSCGSKDWFYKNQVIHFYNDCIENGCDITFYVKNYKRHSQNSRLLKANLCNWLDDFYDS